MRGWSRCLWVLLLVLCVPLKALAATTGLLCPHAGQHGGAAWLLSEPDSATAGAGHAHCHQDGDAVPAAPAEGAAAADAPGEAGDEAAPQGCGTHAHCCTAAAPAPAAGGIGLAPLPPAWVPHARTLVSGFVGDVPHRPPR